MNTATINGATYTARHQMRGQTGTCAGCAANDQRLLASEQSELCKQLPSCQASVRADGRFVVWIRSH